MAKLPKSTIPAGTPGWMNHAQYPSTAGGNATGRTGAFQPALDQSVGPGGLPGSTPFGGQTGNTGSPLVNTSSPQQSVGGPRAAGRPMTGKTGNSSGAKAFTANLKQSIGNPSKGSSKRSGGR